jgi:hypothetical protein
MGILWRKFQEISRIVLLGEPTPLVISHQGAKFNAFGFGVAQAAFSVQFCQAPCMRLQLESLALTHRPSCDAQATPCRFEVEGLGGIMKRDESFRRAFFIHA